MTNEILKNMDQLVLAIKKSNESEESKIDDLQSLERYMLAFPDYLNTVIDYVIRGRIISVWYDGEEYRDRMQRLDYSRRQKHIMAAEAVNKLNRLAQYYEVPKLFDLDFELDSSKVEDREFAVKLTYRFCVDIFLDEVVKSGYHFEKSSLDDTIMKMIESKNHFRTEKLKERMESKDAAASK